jgi:hypothetical protein
LTAAFAKNGAAVVGYLEKHGRAFQLTDSSFVIEIEFFKGMVGADGEKVLQAQCQALMPSGTKQKDITTVLTEVRKIQATELYKFCDSSTQNTIANVADFICDLMEGRSPKFVTNPSDFLVRIRTSLQFFCVIKDAAGKILKVGDDAVKQLCSAILAKKPDEVKLDALAEPVMFMWLLSPVDQQTLTALRKTVIAKTKLTLESAATTTGSSSTASSSTSRPPTSAQPKPASSGKPSELEAALRMFKGKS